MGLFESALHIPCLSRDIYRSLAGCLGEDCVMHGLAVPVGAGGNHIAGLPAHKPRGHAAAGRSIFYVMIPIS